MTTLLLIRHGETDANGNRLTGWQSGWPLNSRGKEQVRSLIHVIRNYPITAIYTSPLQRCVETAELLGHPRGLRPIAVDTLGEVRVGEWTGMTLAELEGRE